MTLASLHAAKGLEWDTVFLVGCSEGLLPITMADTPEAVEEERRLLYVGVTRARQRLVLSYAGARTPGAKPTRRPSRFLEGDGSRPRRGGSLTAARAAHVRCREGPRLRCGRPAASCGVGALDRQGAHDRALLVVPDDHGRTAVRDVAGVAPRDVPGSGPAGLRRLHRCHPHGHRRADAGRRRRRWRGSRASVPRSSSVTARPCSPFSKIFLTTSRLEGQVAFRAGSVLIAQSPENIALPPARRLPYPRQSTSRVRVRTRATKRAAVRRVGPDGDDDDHDDGDERCP